MFKDTNNSSNNNVTGKPIIIQSAITHLLQIVDSLHKYNGDANLQAELQALDNVMVRYLEARNTYKLSKNANVNRNTTPGTHINNGDHHNHHESYHSSQPDDINKL